MLPDQAGAMGIETRRVARDGDRLAVTSRRRALDRLWAAYRGGFCGPVLITGEPGAGKSWLVHRFTEGLPAGWRSAEVELTSALDGPELLRLIGDQLGLQMPDRLGSARLTLGAGLRDAEADGRSWLLVLDEAQRATAGTWEEIQALGNPLGRPGGFAGLILLGRTELARGLSAHRLQGLASRLGLHLHLPPLDLDEARALLRLEPRITEPELETIHRDAMGNPRAMLRLAGSWRRASGPVGLEPIEPGRRAVSSRFSRPLPVGPTLPGEEDMTTDAGIPAPTDDLPPPKLPSLIPARPPIRLEEGLVEVGWEGDLESEPTALETPPDEPEAARPSQAERNEELVEDRYAALQAWVEWSRNRERSVPAVVGPADGGTAPGEDPDPDARPVESTPEESGPIVPSNVRVEPPQEFAPYSQLFSRLRHSL